MIKFSRLKEISGGDAEIEKELLSLFLSSINTATENLTTAVAHKDLGGLQAAIHELKGCAANIGFDDLYNLCQEAETPASLPFSESHGEVLAALLQEIEKIRKTIEV